MLKITVNIAALAAFLLSVITSVGQETVKRPFSRWSLEYKDSVNRTFTGTEYTEFDLTTLDGRRITSASCKGKITIFIFWREGCLGCRQEINELNELYDSLKQYSTVEFVAITDDEKEGLPEFLQKNHMRYPVATVYKEEVLQRLNYHNGYPSIAILDKNGRISLLGNRNIIHSGEEHFGISVGKFMNMVRSMM